LSKTVVVFKEIKPNSFYYDLGIITDFSFVTNVNTFFVKGLIGGGVVALFRDFGEILYCDKNSVLEQHLFNVF